MASLRQVRRRIQSVKNTQQITRAMKMVAAAKLRRSQERLMQSRPYSDLMKEVVTRLALRAKADLHPLLKECEERRCLLVTITSDRGLCGAFNANVLRRAASFLVEKKSIECSFLVVGKKASDFYKRSNFRVIKTYLDVFQNVQFRQASEIAANLVDLFVKEEYDSIYLLYNSFKSAIQQVVTLNRILPIRTSTEAEAYSIDYIYEPSSDAILEDLLPKYVESQVFRALLESLAGEQGARMSAMEAATENASEMI